MQISQKLGPNLIFTLFYQYDYNVKLERALECFLRVCNAENCSGGPSNILDPVVKVIYQNSYFCFFWDTLDLWLIWLLEHLRCQKKVWHKPATAIASCWEFLSPFWFMFFGEGGFPNSEEMKEYEKGKWRVTEENFWF